MAENIFTIINDTSGKFDKKPKSRIPPEDKGTIYELLDISTDKSPDWDDDWDDYLDSWIPYL